MPIIESKNPSLLVASTKQDRKIMPMMVVAGLRDLEKQARIMESIIENNNDKVVKFALNANHNQLPPLLLALDASNIVVAQLFVECGAQLDVLVNHKDYMSNRRLYDTEIETVETDKGDKFNLKSFLESNHEKIVKMHNQKASVQEGFQKVACTDAAKLLRDYCDTLDQTPDTLIDVVEALASVAESIVKRCMPQPENLYEKLVQLEEASPKQQLETTVYTVTVAEPAASGKMLYDPDERDKKQSNRKSGFFSSLFGGSQKRPAQSRDKVSSEEGTSKPTAGVL